MNIKGALNVSRRTNTGLKKYTLSDNHTVTELSHAWLSFDPNGTNRNILLPDATALQEGWSVIIHNIGNANSLLVKDSNGTTLKTITSPATSNETKAYEFVLITNGSVAGVWNVIELGDPTIDVAKFYTEFEISDWSVPSNGLCTYVVLGSTHGRGLNPIWIIHEMSGAKINCHIENINTTTGDITLTVPEDDVFDGFIIII